LAAAAAQRKPNDAEGLTVLGAAHYRLSRFDESIAALSRAESIGGGRHQVTRVAFQVLAHERASQVEPARIARGELLKLMHDPLNSAERDNRALLSEIGHRTDGNPSK